MLAVATAVGLWFGFGAADVPPLTDPPAVTSSTVGTADVGGTAQA